MRAIQRLIVSSVLALGLSAGIASAATTASQLVDLARAGLDDDILIALIQTDGSTFELTAADILALHKQGLSDRVIRAMQETGRPPAPLMAEPLPAPVVQEPVPIPIAPPAIVNVYQTVTQHVEAPAPPMESSYAIPIAVPVYVTVPVRSDRRPEPAVYWGWGGQRRPDSWQPDPEPRREPVQQPPVKNKGS